MSGISVVYEGGGGSTVSITQSPYHNLTFSSNTSTSANLTYDGLSSFIPSSTFPSADWFYSGYKTDSITKGIVDDNVTFADELMSDLDNLLSTEVIGNLTIFDMFSFMSKVNPILRVLSTMGRLVSFKNTVRTVIDSLGAVKSRFRVDSDDWMHLTDLGLEVVEIINDLDANTQNVNDIFDCESKWCELFELAFEETIARKLGNAIGDHQSQNPDKYIENDDSFVYQDNLNNTYVEIDGQNIFENSLNTIIEINKNNGEITIDTVQKSNILTEKSKELSPSIKEKMKQKGDELNRKIQDSVNRNRHNYAMASNTLGDTKYYYIDLATNDAKKEYALRRARYDLLAKTLYKMAETPCQTGDNVVPTIESAFGDVLVDGGQAEQIFDDYMEEKKTPTDCCIAVCCDPCNYKLVEGV